MSEPSHSASRSQRFGGWLARAGRTLLRQEIRFTKWLVTQGTPVYLAKTVLWLLKIALIVIVAYAVLWLAIALAIAFLAARIFGRADLDADPYAWEWKHGSLGVGLYDKSGQRLDPDDSK
jgi:hypothetical protein